MDDTKEKVTAHPGTILYKTPIKWRDSSNHITANLLKLTMVSPNHSGEHRVDDLTWDKTWHTRRKKKTEDVWNQKTDQVPTKFVTADSLGRQWSSTDSTCLKKIIQN